MISAQGGSTGIARCDVSDPDDVTRLQQAVAHEDISILINNAGVAGPVANLTEVQPADWDQVFAVNVRGTYLMCRGFLPRMIEQGRGDIINIASVTGKRPLAGRTPYAASKLAILGLTATLAFEVGPLGIAVNSLSPGPVRGARMRRNFQREAQRSGTTAEQAEKDFVSRAAYRRLVEEDEIAEAAAAMLNMPGLAGADIDLSAGMIAR